MTLEELKSFIELGLIGFENDPPDTEFQKGYLACLQETLAYITKDE